jgi:hypothetical protein
MAHVALPHAYSHPVPGAHVSAAESAMRPAAVAHLCRTEDWESC